MYQLNNETHRFFFIKIPILLFNWHMYYVYQRKNMRIGKISNSAEYRMNEKLQNLKIFRA